MAKKGERMSEETKQKLSASAKENWANPAYRQRQSEAHKGNVGYWGGKTFSEEHRRKISKGKKGQPSPRKGVVLSDETKEKISKTKKDMFDKGEIIHPMLGKKHTKESRAKMSASNMGKWRGEKSPCWKGGITPERKKAMRTTAYKSWREFVFERDDYTCQECMTQGGILNAHHSKSWEGYPRLRYQTWNGITLCKKCHMIYHGLNKGGD